MHKSLHWRHNDHGGVSHHQPRGCLLNCIFRGKWKKTSKLCVTGLWAGNSPGTGEFPTQRASNAENVPIWWHHHVDHHYWPWGAMRVFVAILRHQTYEPTVDCRYNAIQYSKTLIKWIIAGTQTDYQSDAGSTKDMLWGVFCEYLWENWLHYNSTALYLPFNSLRPSNTFVHRYTRSLLVQTMACLAQSHCLNQC